MIDFMRRLKHIFIVGISILIAILTASCSEDLIDTEGCIGDQKVFATIEFGHTNYNEVNVTTRSELGLVAESHVFDLYVYIFDKDTHKRIYGHYFGTQSLKATEAEVTGSDVKEECWYVNNMSSDTGEKTKGVIRIQAPTISNGKGTMYIVANAKDYSVTISPEILNTIRTEDELKQLTAVLDGDVVLRYGYFPMVAKVNDVSISKDAVTSASTNEDTKFPAQLTRLDAKIKVNIRAAKGYQYEYPENSGNMQTVKSFTPVSWRVCNVPKGTFVIEGSGNDDGITGYFNTDEKPFESAEKGNFTYMDNSIEKTVTDGTTHGFIFYMLENRWEAQKQITDNDRYKRETRKKNLNGELDESTGLWEYAPENATYIEIKGHLAMKANMNGAIQELGADVVYYIHLGDFNANANNYDVERNTTHNYTITIKGVKNIEIEVEASKNNKTDERQSGATGDVYRAEQGIKMFDAHYEQFVYTLYADNIDKNKMEWYVSTPFGQIGSPKFNNPDAADTELSDMLKDYDYKWVWFMINPITDNKYDTNSQMYPGNHYKGDGDGTEKRLMDVNEFVEYIKDQKDRYDTNKTESNHIFRKDDTEKYSVYITVFVDEYYYESHPITGETRTDLWKDFANKDARLMHILCDSYKSLDTQSTTINSVITIRQRSIQTPYNITDVGEDPATGWGCETVDEFSDDLLWFYNDGNTNDDSKSHDSPNNGRFNTAILLGLMDTKYETSEDASVDVNKWITYTNNGSTINDSYKYLLYCTLLRNRDNDGDGIIDAEELRWYVASLEQLYGIYIGELGFLDPSARLYTKEKANSGTKKTDEGNNYQYFPWREHIVSSTRHIDRNGTTFEQPTEIWAEEGISTSHYKQYRSGNESLISIRCIRDLGMDASYKSETAIAAIEDKNNVALPLIQYTVKDASGNITSNEDANMNTNYSYEFDLSRVNGTSLRISPTNMDLIVKNEFDDLSRPYRYFKTGQLYESDGNYQTLRKDYLDNQTSPESDPNEGWRVPNLREAAIMRLYCTNSLWWDSKFIPVSTYYYNGNIENGGNGNKEGAYSWYFGYNYATVEASYDGIRYVKDNP